MAERVDLKALDNISYGVYVVTSRDRDGNRVNGLTVNTVIQVALDPCLVAVAINKNSLTHELIRDSGVMAVSVLEQDTPLGFVGRFGFKSGREVNKFEGLNYQTEVTGAPILIEHAVAVIEARIRSEVDCVTHTVFIGEVVAARPVGSAEPLTYSYYRKVKKGTTGKGSPTYRAETKERITEKKGANKMKRYVCTVCGYVYDPAEGDPENDVPAGTPFENLPAEWVCPVCGASKDQFEPEE